jgi:6-phosphogluconolactonase
MLPYDPSAISEAMLSTLEAAALARGRATLAIPGGRSPGPVLTQLARQCDAFLRQRLHLLWVDERAVPRGTAERNDAVTLAAWQQGGPLPAAVHPMPAEDTDLEAAAIAYATTLAQATGGTRRIDVCLLGIGEDGHCASLFPDHPGLAELADVFVVYDSPKPPPRRLTLSLPILHRAESLVILVTGEVKGGIAKAAWTGADRHLPVSLLPPSRCQWYLDDAAVRAARS